MALLRDCVVNANILLYFLCGYANGQFFIVGFGHPRAECFVELYTTANVPNLKDYRLVSEKFTHDFEEIPVQANTHIIVTALKDSHDIKDFLEISPSSSLKLYYDDNIKIGGGDDGFRLLKDGEPVDFFGDQLDNCCKSTDPCYYKDGWAKRKNGSIGPDKPYVVSNWIYAPDGFDNCPGFKNRDCPQPYPLGFTAQTTTTSTTTTPTTAPTTTTTTPTTTTQMPTTTTTTTPTTTTQMPTTTATTPTTTTQIPTSTTTTPSTTTPTTATTTIGSTTTAAPPTTTLTTSTTQSASKTDGFSELFIRKSGSGNPVSQAGVISVSVARSRIQCAILCKQKPQCLSFSFNGGMCRLINTPAHATNTGDQYYYERDNV